RCWGFWPGKTVAASSISSACCSGRSSTLVGSMSVLAQENWSWFWPRLRVTERRSLTSVMSSEL
ncbi:MAG: hypothetical protein ACE5JG_06365, partial [Planctomycetota bacterium]